MRPIQYLAGDAALIFRCEYLGKKEYRGNIELNVSILFV